MVGGDKLEACSDVGTLCSEVNELSFLQGMLLDEQTGCLLKFSGELEDVSREDFHDVFSGHGKIKWVDFTRGAKEVQKCHLCI